ncbi:hypothetical protein [Streptomyces sp. NPDC053427]|uniref:hypothetical protein n=1 Tax=Streptomyces sp. NPDC053427 TaxID=3365701 RepID=UPI0037D5F6CD
MPRISCHFPITVSLRPDASAADLERLGQAVAEQLTERLGEARQQLERLLTTASEPPVSPDSPLGRRPQEPVDPGRITEDGTFYQVPSYDVGGALRPVDLRAAAPPPPSGAGQAGAHPAADQPFDVTAAHAGGAYGEHDLPFELGRRGMRMLVTSSGPGAHQLTGHGVDAVAFNPSNGEIWLIDNKATGRRGKLEGKSATALGENLGTSLTEAVTQVRGMPDFPEKAGIVRRLESALEAVRAGSLIPKGLGIRLKLTNAGGYGQGARNLPPQVEPEDLVGPEVRAQRKKDEAAARKLDVRTGRPAGHEETTAMRERVGGTRSRKPVPDGQPAPEPGPKPMPAQETRVPEAPAPARPAGPQLGRRLRAIGGEVLVLAALLVWETLISKLEQAIESAWLRSQTDRRMRELEPVITARLDALADDLAEVQLAHPGAPLFGVIGLLTTVYRAPGEGEEAVGCSIEVTSVSVGTERVERTEHARIWVGSWLTARAPRDLTRWVFPVALEPLSRAELRDYLLRRIAAEESATGASSSTPEERLASQYRRDELLRRLGESGTP